MVAILVLQWLPLVQAGWSIRDDYDFVSSMNDHGRISFHDFVERLNPFEMELGSVVNRPIYVIVHDLWMLVIGNNLPVWQSAKIFTFGMAMALCIWFFALATDPVAAGFLTFFVGFQSGWADVVPRANAELFGVVGLMIYAIGNLQLVLTPSNVLVSDGKKASTFYVLLVVFGGSIAVASKENFCFTVLVISVALLLFALLLEKRPRLAVAQVVPLAVSLFFCGLIAHGMAGNGGKALYGQTFAPVTIFMSALTRCVTGGVTTLGASRPRNYLYGRFPGDAQSYSPLAGAVRVGIARDCVSKFWLLHRTPDVRTL